MATYIPPFTTGVYQPTSAFLAIPLHAAVCTGAGDLIAVTGPAPNQAAQAYAALFAAAPGLMAAAKEGREACRLLAQKHMEAGDFESAGYWTRKANEIGATLEAATPQA